MKKCIAIVVFIALLSTNKSAAQQPATLYFFGNAIQVPQPPVVLPFSNLSAKQVQAFVQSIDANAMQPYLQALQQYKSAHQVDDWLYYQLIRHVAQFISPKADNYNRYTMYKWWLLVHSGYDARLYVSGNFLLFYVQSNEAVYNIPYRLQNGLQYVCLNYHDYDAIDFNRHVFEEIELPVTTGTQPFSYKVNHMPSFQSGEYKHSEVRYEDGDNIYTFRVKLNPQVKNLFTNYPVVDYSLQFNIPLSQPVYQSLIPELTKHVRQLSEKEGIDFLMRFTRYAFLFKPDTEVFGAEKRLSPEQTLLYEYSDCEDRAALFYYLVKELYNLPMLILVYPQHVNVAVQFKKAYGQTVEYNGLRYTICEPSPQRYDLRIGEVLPELKKQSYQVAYAYHPN